MRARLGEHGLQFDDNRQIVALSEGGKRYEARNPAKKRVLCYQVDGGMLGQPQKACDYLVGLPKSDIVYLIELKGNQLRDAVAQIASTIARLGNKLNGNVINGRVVLSRVQRPDIRTADVLILARNLAKTGGSLVYKSVQLTEDI